MGSKIVEFIPERIVRRKIIGKSVECLFYSLITEDGEYITDGHISSKLVEVLNHTLVNG